MMKGLYCESMNSEQIKTVLWMNRSCCFAKNNKKRVKKKEQKLTGNILGQKKNETDYRVTECCFYLGASSKVVVTKNVQKKRNKITNLSNTKKEKKTVTEKLSVRIISHGSPISCIILIQSFNVNVWPYGLLSAFCFIDLSLELCLSSFVFKNGFVILQNGLIKSLLCFFILLKFSSTHKKAIFSTQMFCMYLCVAFHFVL